MAAALEETPVSYEDLADIEREFDDVETEIIRQQVQLTTPLYERRSKTVSQIPNFWPLVLEQAPSDIDQYIQPSDSALLLSSLTSLSVSHFEIQTEKPDKCISRDPRSVSIRFEFAENEYFENKVLEKKFWYRRSKDGWSGLVSEPVPIKWKKDRDLTGGLLDMVVKAWEVARSSPPALTKTNKGELTPEQKALKKKIENTGMGGLSFFAWFGFIGRHVSAEESAQATALEREKRSKRGRSHTSDSSEEEEDDEEDDDLGMSLEIFPDGDDLAVAFTDDLWPGAIKYFTQAQEQDALSDADFESDDDDDDDEADEPAFNSGAETEEENGGRPTKKRRSE
ncbi:NAP family protein-like protein [Mollisia scopiformis]|uniref:NAP family protein-like protein n=1 Tax=Mollisia scopiformis TaxID=149040 RepID=A0A132B3V3_MOLSC|nr:NAP family protein-like protein [Mollisia scopiformis]KUJ06709.1 NAP family protein-like protein [Mollisia scopiformis]